MQHVADRTRLWVLNSLGVTVSAETLYRWTRDLAVAGAPEATLSKQPPGRKIVVAGDNHDRSSAYQEFRPSSLGGGKKGLHCFVFLCYLFPDKVSLSAAYEALRAAYQQLLDLAPGEVLRLLHLLEPLRHSPLVRPITLSDSETSALRAVESGTHTARERQLATGLLETIMASLQPLFLKRRLLPAQSWLTLSDALPKFRRTVQAFHFAWARSLARGHPPPVFKSFLLEHLGSALPPEVTKIMLRPLLEAPNSATVVKRGLELVREQLGGYFGDKAVNITFTADEAVLRHILSLQKTSSDFNWLTPFLGLLHLQMNSSVHLLRSLVPAGLGGVMLAAGYTADQVSKLDKLDYDRRNALLKAVIHGLWLAITLVAVAISRGAIMLDC
jgi:hypothetical protein